MSEIKQGYKQTKVGIIPQDWEVVNFDDLKDKTDRHSITGGPFGSDLKSVHYTSSGVRVIQLQNIGDGKFLNKEFVYTSEEKANQLKNCLIYPNEIILAKMAEPVARACLIPSFDDKFLMCSDGIRLLVDKNRFSTKYVLEYINYDLFRKIAIDRSTGSTRGRIGLSDLKTIPLVLPPLKEQQKIAEILTTWDEAITKQEELIALKEQLKKGLMQKLLSGEVRFKEFGSEALASQNKSGTKVPLPNEWEEVRLGKYIKEISKKNKENVELVLSVTNKHGFIAQKDYFDKEVASKDTSNYKIAKKGNFAYNPSRINVGSLGLLEEYEIGILSPMYVIFECLKGLDKQYLNYWLNTHNFTGNLSKFLSGSVRDSLAFNDMKLMKIKLPSLPEQQKIAEVLSLADDEINLLKNELDELKLQKKALMQKLLTGEVRVRV